MVTETWGEWTCQCDCCGIMSDNSLGYVIFVAPDEYFDFCGDCWRRIEPAWNAGEDWKELIKNEPLEC